MVSLERVVPQHAAEFRGASHDMYDITHTHTICGVPRKCCGGDFEIFKQSGREIHRASPESLIYVTLLCIHESSLIFVTLLVHTRKVVSLEEVAAAIMGHFKKECLKCVI